MSETLRARGARREPARSLPSSRRRAGPAPSSRSGGRPQAARPARPRSRHAGVPLAALLGAVALVVGWWMRDERYLSPEEGLGYALGIVGLGAMLLLLLYSARKRMRSLARWGPLRHWFGVHMLLGVLGPVAIGFHANFEAASPNARIALAAMVLVATSGFVGRFVHARVHRGLYGRRQSLREVASQADASRLALAAALAAQPALAARVRAFEEETLAARPGLLQAPLRILQTARRARAIRAQARRLTAGAGPRPEPLLRAHLAAVRRVADFAFYERALALWHAVHLPLCVLLFTAAAIHVVAAHLY